MDDLPSWHTKGGKAATNLDTISKGKAASGIKDAPTEAAPAAKSAEKEEKSSAPAEEAEPESKAGRCKQRPRLEKRPWFLKSSSNLVKIKNCFFNLNPISELAPLRQARSC